MYKKNHHILALAAGLMFLLISGCSSNSYNPTSPSNSGSSSNTGGGQYTVSMAGNAFSPSSLVVPRNTTVTWNNNSSIAHTSTSDTGVWDTGNIPAGSMKQTTFTTAGTYHYHCTYHSYMVGVVTVQ